MFKVLLSAEFNSPIRILYEIGDTFGQVLLPHTSNTLVTLESLKTTNIIVKLVNDKLNRIMRSFTINIPESVMKQKETEIIEPFEFENERGVIMVLLMNKQLMEQQKKSQIQQLTPRNSHKEKEPERKSWKERDNQRRRTETDKEEKFKLKNKIENDVRSLLSESPLNTPTLRDHSRQPTLSIESPLRNNQQNACLQFLENSYSVEEATIEIDKFKRLIHNLQNQLSTDNLTRNSLSECELTINKVTEDNLQIQKQIQSLSEEYEQYRRDQTTTVNSLQSLVQQLKQMNGQLTLELMQRNSHTQSLKTEISSLKHQLATITSQQNVQQPKQVIISTQYEAQFAASIEQLNGIIDQLNSKIKYQAQLINELQQQIVDQLTSDSQIVQLQSILKAGEKNFEQLQADNNDLKQQTQLQENIIKQQQSQQNILEASISQYKHQIQEIQKSSNTLIQQLQVQQQKNKQLKHIISGMREHFVAYIPFHGDPVDSAVADFLNGIDDQKKIYGSVQRLGDGLYRIGRKEVYLKSEKGKVFAKIGGGFIGLEEYLDVHFKQ